MEQKLKDLIIYMTVCADGLQKEPKIYGSLRLIESVRSLAEILIENGCDEPVLEDLIKMIDEDKYKSMSDADGFYEMIHQSVLMLVDM